MAEAPPQSAPEKAPDAKLSLREQAMEAATRAFVWSIASRRNKIISGALTVVALAAVIAAWSYLAHMALGDGNLVTVELALQALDAGAYDEAKQIVAELSNLSDPDKFGLALFVMGSVKAKEADDEFSPERRRAMHAVAARYLQKARLLGVPADREPQIRFLLGRSLIKGNQSAAGVELLELALQSPEMPGTEIHSLLAAAYLDKPDPDLDRALAHLQSMLDDPQLPAELRTDAVLRQTEVLLRLEKPELARHAMSALPENQESQAVRELLTGEMCLVESTSLPAGDPQRTEKLAEADRRIREALRLDRSSGSVKREAEYWLGKCFAARGDVNAALEEFQRLGKLNGDTPEGLAAILSSAELFREKGDYERALAGYRALLDLAPAPAAYVNQLLPLSTLRKRLLVAQQEFVDAGRFEDAVDMLDLFQDLFSEVEIVEMRAKTQAQWGAAFLAPHAKKDRWRADDDEAAGRLRLRTAGRAYEDLARLRFSEREFPDDLWLAAENYFFGQSYASAARVFQEYLQHESRTRNALALLRLGQSSLAVGDYQAAVGALDECIEMFPHSDTVFQARLESARAYRELGKNDEAEQLLWTNLTGDNLLPSSPEWKDSKFEIGRLYYEIGRFDDAVRELEEAVLRYPDDPDNLLANYTIARASHRAAESPAKRAREAKTENERAKNRSAMVDYLERALKTYADVQRAITLAGGSDHDPLMRTLLRNCYMMRGGVLFDLRRFDEAREAYSGLSSLYQNDPFVLEIQIQIASCLRRLNEPVKARLAIVQAQQLLAALPPNADFLATTNFNRQQWELLLNQMAAW